MPDPNYDSLNRAMRESSKPAPTNIGNFSEVVPQTQVDESGRYPTFYIGRDNEDLYGRTQYTLDKWKAGGVKFLNNVGTTILGGTAGLVYGAYKWADEGNFASLFDNDFTQALDAHNKDMENSWANYMSNEERDANWYSPKTWATANFWSDTILKNAGFAVGAYLSGGAWAKAAKLVVQASRGVALGAGIDVLSVADRAARAERMSLLATKAGGIENLTGNLKSIADSYVRLDKIKNAGYLAARSAVATYGESSVEAIQASNAHKDVLINEYRDKFGVDPTGSDLEGIEESAEKVGRTTFGLNSALLTLTNYWQFPKIMGAFNKAERSILSGAERGVGRVTLRNAEGQAVEAGTREAGEGLINNTLRWDIASSKLGGRLAYARAGATTLFAPSEAFEEASQFVIPFAAQDYFKKGYDGEANSFLESAKEGAKELFTSKEGALSILTGGLVGGLMTNFNPFMGGRFLNDIRTVRDRNTNTARFVDQLNSTTIGNPDLVLSTVQSLNREATLSSEAELALRNNNRLQYEDTRTDRMLNFLLPRIQYGRKDLVDAEIDSLIEVASTDEGFAQLQEAGYASKDEDLNKEDYINNLSKIKDTAATAASQFEALNLRYGKQVDESGRKVYSPESIMQMAYVGAKINDYNSRSAELTSNLLSAGLNISDLLERYHSSALTWQEEQDMRASGATQEEINEVREERRMSRLEDDTLNNLADQINSIPTLTREEKDDLIQESADLLEIAARRDFKIKEYEQIQKYPELYSSPSQDPISLAGDGEVDFSRINFSEVEGEQNQGDYEALKSATESQWRGEELTDTQLDLIEDYPNLHTSMWKTLSEQQARAQQELAEEEGWYTTSDGTPVPPTSRSIFVDANPQQMLLEVNGVERLGRLVYNADTDTIHFIYEDEQGNPLQVEVLQSDLLDGIITPDSTLVDTGYLSEDVSEVEATKRDNQIHVNLENLLEETVNRQFAIEGEIAEIQKDLSQIREDLEGDLTTNLADTVFTLTEIRGELEQRLAQLTNELQAVQSAIPELERLSNSPTDNLSTSTELLKAEVAGLESFTLQAGQLINSYQKLLNAVVKLLSTLGKKLISRITSLSGIPRTPAMDSIVLAKDAIDVNNIENFTPQLQELTRVVREEAANAENFLIKPLTQGERSIIDNQIQQVQNALTEVEDKVRAKNFVLDLLQDVSNQVRTREEIRRDTPESTLRTGKASDIPQEEDYIEDQISAIPQGKDTAKKDFVKEATEAGISEESADTLFEDIWDGSGIPQEEEAAKDSAVAKGKALEENKKSQEENPEVISPFDEQGDKTPINRYFNATVQAPANLRGKIWDKNITKLISKIGSIPKSQRSKLRLVTVTPNTQEAQGLGGFVEKYFTTSEGAPFTSDSPVDAPIGLVVMSMQEDGSLVPVDVNGNILERTGEGYSLDQVVGTKMKSASLAWSNGQPAYSNPENLTDEEIATRLNNFLEDRVNIISSDTPQVYPFTTSQGRSRKDSATTPSPLIETMVSLEDLSAYSLKIFQNREANKNGVVPYKGRYFKPGQMILEGGELPLQVHQRKLSSKEISNIKKALSFLVERRDIGDTTSEDFTNTVDFLTSTTFISFDNKFSIFRFGKGPKVTLSLSEIQGKDGTISTVITGVQDVFRNQSTRIDAVYFNRKSQNLPVLTNFKDGVPVFEDTPYKEYVLNPTGVEPLMYAPEKVDKYLIRGKAETTSQIEQPTPVEESVKATAKKAAVIVGDSTQELEDTVRTAKTYEDLVGIVRDYFTRYNSLSSRFNRGDKLIELNRAKAAASVVFRVASTIAERQGITTTEALERFDFTNIASQLEEGSLKQIGGILAAQNLDTSEGTTNRIDQYLRAQRLTDEGTPVGVIRNLTGWEQIDGEWKYEFDDKSLKRLKKKPSETSTTVVKLSDVYDTSILERAYPGIENTQVILDPSMRPGEGSNLNGVIELSPADYNNNPSRFLYTLVHELQHTVQMIEGFPQGGSQEHALIFLNSSKLGFNSYEEAISSVERLVERANEISSMPPISESLMQRANELLSELLNMEDYTSNTIYTTYRKIAGEVESNLASERLALTNEERLSITLGDMQEFSDEDKIYLQREAAALTSSVMRSSLQPSEVVNEDGSGASSQIKGAFRVIEDGRAIIYAATGEADVSTLLHEVAHAYYEWGLTEEEKALVNKESKKYHLQNPSVNESLSESEKIQEYFARGFERFLAEDNPQSLRIRERDTLSVESARRETSRLKSIFSRLRDFLIGIYKDITNSLINIDLSPEVKNLYAEMMGVEFYTQNSKGKGFKPSSKSPTKESFQLPKEVVGSTITSAISDSKVGVKKDAQYTVLAANNGANVISQTLPTIGGKSYPNATIDPGHSVLLERGTSNILQVRNQVVISLMTPPQVESTKVLVKKSKAPLATEEQIDDSVAVDEFIEDIAPSVEEEEVALREVDTDPSVSAPNLIPKGNPKAPPIPKEAPTPTRETTISTTSEEAIKRGGTFDRGGTPVHILPYYNLFVSVPKSVMDQVDKANRLDGGSATAVNKIVSSTVTEAKKVKIKKGTKLTYYQNGEAKVYTVISEGALSYLEVQDEDGNTFQVGPASKPGGFTQFEKDFYLRASSEFALPEFKTAQEVLTWLTEPILENEIVSSALPQIRICK